MPEQQMPGKNPAKQMRELVKGRLKSRAANAQEMRIDRHTSHAQEMRIDRHTSHARKR